MIVLASFFNKILAQNVEVDGNSAAKAEMIFLLVCQRTLLEEIWQIAFFSPLERGKRGDFFFGMWGERIKTFHESSDKFA